MSRVRLTLIALGTAFALPALTGAAAAPPTTSHSALIGTWRSAVEQTPLSSSFDESVWGKNAKATRAATSIEHAELTIGEAQPPKDVRSDFAVTVKLAERRYPDDPGGTWPLDGLRVMVSTFADDPSRIEVRVDTPEGRGSFWETLRRAKS